MKSRILFVIITVVASMLILLRRKRYGIGVAKSIISLIYVAIFGALGTYIMFFIESGRWGGTSFYGTVFIIPVCLLPYSLLVKQKYTNLLDFFVPELCLASSMAKVLCLINHCCNGIILYRKSIYELVRFPSQIVECVLTLLLMVMFLYFEHKGLFKGKFYPLFFVIYGSLRFALNFLRDDLSAFVWFIPSGHFWSIVAILIGTIWLLLSKQKQNQTK